jgi:DHA1 family tetracycline resistance protein-like MFS transporter
MQGVVVGPATARFGDRRVMVFGLAGMALSLLAMGFAPSAAWFVVALIPSALGGLAEPTIRSQMSRRVSETEQGRLQGAAQSVASIAGVVGPVFFGWVYGLSSLSMPGLSFVIAAGILFVAAWCSAGTGKR